MDVTFPTQHSDKREFWCRGEGLPIVKDWVEKGHRDKEIIEMMHISSVAFYDWKKNEPLFKNIFQVGRRIAAVELVNTMIKSAHGFHYTEEVVDNKGQIVEVQKYQPPNVQAQTFLLKNWDRQNYRDRWDVDVSGAVPVILKGEDQIPD